MGPEFEVRPEGGPAGGGPAGGGPAGGGGTQSSDHDGVNGRRARPSPQELDALGDEIAQLAGQIAAATARFLALLGDFDALGGWGGVGIRSLAHWLSWRAGMSLRTAREHIRVARAMRELPRTAEAFGKGELSFSKVRALTRVATPDNEESLLNIAMNAPAAHVERLVAGLRKAAPKDPLADDADAAGSQDDEADTGTDEAAAAAARSRAKPAEAPKQSLQWRWDEDTDELVVWGRFGAADGRVLLAALTRSELERVRTLAHEALEDDAPAEDLAADGRDEPAGADEPAGQSAATASEHVEAVDRTAPPPSDAGPALVALAQIGLTVQDAPAYAPAAEVIYLHQRRADVGVAGRTENGSAEHPENGSAEHHEEPLRDGVVSADDGPALDAGTGEEVMCGARARCVLKGANGAVLAYGLSRRLFSSAQLRALRLRDRCCQTPGCQRTRFLHAHHVVFWSDGGATDLDNAVLLCSGCHRAVHLGRLKITALEGQRFRFVEGSTGRVLQEAPPLFGLADEILANRTITPRTVTGGWEGEPLDLSLATSELLFQWRQRRRTPPRPDDDPSPWDDPGRRSPRNPWNWQDVA